ncbi:MAG TPA: hypothetical protein VHP38_06460 [Ruminiclostridium sp.]|nr:hypothetical protein [Ruminiclostridium sp.]
MRRMPFLRPTDYYDENVVQTDEKICELIKQRKDISNNNPGYPALEYIIDWSEKFDLYEDQLKSLFYTMWNEKTYRPFVEPKDFQKNIPVLKSIEVNDRLFSVIYIRQYANSSIVDFNVDWDNVGDSQENRSHHTHFELFIDERYDCRMSDGTGGNGHMHYKYIVSPALPEDFVGIELTFKEYNPPFENNQIGQDIIIRL